MVVLGNIPGLIVMYQLANMRLVGRFMIQAMQVIALFLKRRRLDKRKGRYEEKDNYATNDSDWFPISV